MITDPIITVQEMLITDHEILPGITCMEPVPLTTKVATKTADGTLNHQTLKTKLEAELAEARHQVILLQKEVGQAQDTADLALAQEVAVLENKNI